MYALSRMIGKTSGKSQQNKWITQKKNNKIGMKNHYMKDRDMRKIMMQKIQLDHQKKKRNK